MHMKKCLCNAHDRDSWKWVSILTSLFKILRKNVTVQNLKYWIKKNPFFCEKIEKEYWENLKICSKQLPTWNELLLYYQVGT